MSRKEGYPEAWVWSACVHIYGSPICRATWYKYKQVCFVPDFRAPEYRGKEHIISKTHCQWLMMMAYMRSEQKRPNGKPPVGRGSGITLAEIVKRLNSVPALKQQLDQALGDAIVADGVLGKEVPYWLGRQVGRSPSISTLRRWAKEKGLEFAISKPVPTRTLDVFLQMLA